MNLKKKSASTLLSLMLMVLLGLAMWFSSRTLNNFKGSRGLPVSVIGVHHLGSDYFINQFYVNKSVTDSVGEYGGGGSRMCCVVLPIIWKPNLKADVRWEVRRIIRSSDPVPLETAEVVAIYQAEVPIEYYVEPDHLWVHFFSEGRVRIVVTPFGFDGIKHPIRWGDIHASQKATSGKILKNFFSKKEIAEFAQQIESDRKKHGDWR